MTYKITAVQVDGLILAYLENLIAVLPSKRGITEFVSGGKRDDTKLLKMMKLGNHGCLMRYCTTYQTEMLTLKILGRKSIDCVRKSKTGHQIIEGCKSVFYTNTDIAKIFNCTLGRVKDTLYAGRKAVKKAINENREIHSRNI